LAQLGSNRACAILFLATRPTAQSGLTGLTLRPETLLNENGWQTVKHSKQTNLLKLTRFSEVRNYGSVNFRVFK
jgi:hypothetical protein